MCVSVCKGGRSGGRGPETIWRGLRSRRPRRRARALPRPPAHAPPTPFFTRSKRTLCAPAPTAPQAVRVLFESVASLAAPGSRFCLDWLRLSVLSGRAFNPGFETLAVRSQPLIDS